MTTMSPVDLRTHAQSANTTAQHFPESLFADAVVLVDRLAAALASVEATAADAAEAGVDLRDFAVAAVAASFVRRDRPLTGPPPAGPKPPPGPSVSARRLDAGNRAATLHELLKYHPDARQSGSDLTWSWTDETGQWSERAVPDRDFVSVGIDGLCRAITPAKP
jgi:hypothetical protein